MTQPEKYSFIRYLEAKRTVDDRALNQGVWNHLVSVLEPLPRERPLRLLEVGAGIGTMLERMVEWGICRDLDYTAIDSDPSLLARAAERLLIWAGCRRWRAEKREQGRLLLAGSGQRIGAELLAVDIFDMAGQGNRAWDLVLAHAFLDLVNLETALPLFFSLLRPGGLFYFTLVFDGATVLRPVLDAAFDARVEECYHRSMDERLVHNQSARCSQTGRMLLEALSTCGASILAAGSSDWVIYPPYSGDEAYFLHHILRFMEDTLTGCPDLETHLLEQWLETRHRQVEEGRLIYIAHQMDVLGRP